MFSRLDVIHLILSKYQKFLFYDASVSIIKYRNFNHISIFYRLFTKYYLETVKNINNLDTQNITQSLKNSFEKDCNDILQHYIKDSGLISNDSIENITVLLGRSAPVEKNNIKEILFSSKELVEAFSKFNIAYKQLYNYVRVEIDALLTEFHNALSHLITAIALKSKNENGSKENIIARNIDKAISHLNRGTKDSYKITIKAAYKMYEKYNEHIKLPNGFAEKFIKVRSEEIIYLSDKSFHNSVYDSIKNLSDELIEILHIDNLNFKDEFSNILNDYII